ncbi:MAG: hypothetical protein ACTSRW_01405 [Candidatus Helarchaeota archaeon]
MTEDTDKIELDDFILKDFLRPLTVQSVEDLLKHWGYQVNNSKKSKLNLFKDAIGASLTKEQFHDLWLLREKITVIKNRNWKVLKFDPKKFKELSNEDLKSQLQKEIANRIIEKDRFSLLIQVLDEGELYVIVDLEGNPRIVEEFDHDFKIIYPIQRIRLILEKNGIARLNGGSPQLHSQYIEVLENVLETTFTPQQIFSYVLRDFVYKTSPIKKISLVCPREMGGFSGVERITVEGPDVVRGMDDLRSRQEILFNFDGLSKLGAWVKVHSQSAKLDVNGNIQVSDVKTKKHVLKFFE